MGRTVLQSCTPDREDHPQITLAIRKEEDEHRGSSRERAFVPVRLWAGEGAEVGYRFLESRIVSRMFFHRVHSTPAYLRRWRQTCHCDAIAMLLRRLLRGRPQKTALAAPLPAEVVEDHVSQLSINSPLSLVAATM